MPGNGVQIAADFRLSMSLNRCTRIMKPQNRKPPSKSRSASPVRPEEALRESEQFLRQVIDLVPHFVFAKDEGNR